MMMNNTDNTGNTDNVVLMKTCRSCGVEKSISEYSKHSATRDKLDARCKECVRLVKKNKDRELKPRQRDEMETDDQCNDWQGGKKKGTILRKGDGLFMACVCNKKSKCFRLEQFDMDETKLRESANQFLYRTSLELGYTTNQYKIIFHPETRLPQYLLVQLSKEFVMLCDYDQLNVVKQHHLFVNMCGSKNKHRSHYVGLQDDHTETPKVVPFHKFITGYQVTDHINRYPMDNRRCNLRETSILENNRNRTNYYEPSRSKTISRNVSFDPKKEIWNVSVVMDQQIKKKSFPIQSIGYRNRTN